MEMITLRNGVLTVVLNPVGAVLHSIKMNEIEYLWQSGDPKGWSRRDANLFPFVGRHHGGKYRCGGKEYPMTPHGFCQDALFAVTEQGEDWVRFTLRENPDPRCEYPFPFVFHVSYRLEENRILKTCRVENPGKDTLHFGMGSHPAFRVPVAGEGRFEDWYACFPEPCAPRQVTLDFSNWLLAEERPLYPLTHGDKLPLTHGLFDHDAIILQDAPRAVSLRSSKSDHSVTVEYPQMPYVGLWHSDHAEVDFVCIEPWLTLPARSKYMEDLEQREGFIHLPAGEAYESRITITLE